MHIYRLILIHLLSNLAIWHTVINNKLADIYSHVGYLSWVIYLCSALCTLKPKNLKKSKKPRFFSSPEQYANESANQSFRDVLA